MKKQLLLLFVSLLAIITLVACGTDDDTQQAAGDKDNVENSTDNGETEREIPEFPTDPVTIRVAMPWSEEIFESRFGQIEAKHPHLTIEQVHYNGSREVTFKGLFFGFR